MNLQIVAAMMLYFGTVKGAHQALRTGGEEIITVPEDNSEEKPSRVLALVIVEDIEESEETNPSMKSEETNSSMEFEVMLPLIESPEIMLPWLKGIKPKAFDEDTSEESNSDEYSDSDTISDSETESDSNSESDTDSDSDTDKESYYYHEDDYLKNKIMKKIANLNLVKDNPIFLRNRWKSCQKKASKYCRKACEVSYKNACAEQSCKKKLKSVLKKQCKENCKDFFMES